jgi:hypothetical protein
LSNGGNPEGAGRWGRLFFGYFLLAKQKKVTSCRATPDDVDVENPRGHMCPPYMLKNAVFTGLQSISRNVR